MAVKIAIESFLAVVKRSNLIAAGQLQALVEEFQHKAGGSGDARKCAEFLVARKALTAWQAEKLLQGKHKGFFLGKYRLLSLVGRGGMSSVYLAEHVVMRRRCAIKVLPTRRLQNASYLARFHREAQAVASLDHRNIVRAYDVDLATDNEMEIHFLVMEFVDGKGLLDLVLSSPQTRLPPVVAAEYIRQAALGLQHAHAAGLVHRDVKPGNLLVDRQGTVKVLDLGLARFFETGEETSLTVQHDERVLGTADYLAPEQAVDSHNVDARADIYSLGCTLYLCLTGQPPFTQGTLAQRLLAHQTREPPAVETVHPGVPVELAEIVRKMMAKDPAGRYQSAGEVASVLESWLKTVPRTDLDRSYAGLDRKTPVPPERRSDDVPAARADTLRSGSRADASSTPRVETRRPPVPKKRSAKRPAVAESDHGLAAVPAAILPPVNSADQETMFGNPPQPPDPFDSPIQPLEDVFGDTDQDIRSAAGDDSLAIDLPIEDEPIVRRPAKRQPAFLANVLEKLQERRQQTRVIWTAVGIGVLLVLVLVIRAMREPTEVVSRPPPPLPPTSETTVDKSNLGPDLTVGAQGDFQSIGDALSHIRKYAHRFSGSQSWTVKVTGGQTYEEAIAVHSTGITGGAFPTGVHIVSEGDSPAVLNPPGTGPVVDIEGVERLTLRGFVLAGAKRNIVARLAGQFLVGTRLEDLEFRDVSAVGIAWDDVSGLASAPVQFVNLRFQGQSPSAVAVRMGDVRQARFDGCLFAGPLHTAIEFGSDVWNVDVSIRHCRFHEVQSGIRFSKPGQDIQRVEIVNNTFHRVRNALMWDDMPQAGSSRLTIHHNLFVSTSADAGVVRTGFDSARAQELLPPDNALNNWTDRPAGSASGESGVFDLFARGRRDIQNPAFASTDPANPGFLRPTAPSVTIELKSAAQGADPIVGAIAP